MASLTARSGGAEDLDTETCQAAVHGPPYPHLSVNPGLAVLVSVTPCRQRGQRYSRSSSHRGHHANAQVNCPVHSFTFNLEVGDGSPLAGVRVTSPDPTLPVCRLDSALQGLLRSVETCPAGSLPSHCPSQPALLSLPCP